MRDRAAPVRFLAWATVLVAALAIAAPASAHTALVASSPAEGATVAELAEVSLEFTEELLGIGNELAMVAPDGTSTLLEILEVTSIITAAVPDGAMAPGGNVLRYRVVSADGHPIEGTIAFTYAPDVPSPPASASPSATPSTPATAPGTASASATPASSATAASSPSPSATAVSPTSGVPGWGWILGVAGAAAVAATVVMLARGRGSGDV